MKIRLVFLSLICLVAAGRAQSRAAGPSATSKGFVASTDAQKKRECEKSGGQWGPVGKGSTPICNLPTKDAGQACKTGEDCESACVSNKCYGWQSFRGCGNVKKLGFVCID